MSDPKQDVLHELADVETRLGKQIAEAVARLESGQEQLRAGQVALGDQIQDVARAVRELGGNVPDDPPVEEATG